MYRSTWTEEGEEEGAGEPAREAAGDGANGGGGSSSSSSPRRPSVLRAAAVTQFEANSARTAFPSFDEPALRAPFTLSLEADEGLAAISNMPEASVEEVGEEEISERSEARKRDRRKKKKKAQNAPPFPPPSSLPRPRRLRHVFEPTPAMPTYLVAVVVGPLGENSHAFFDAFFSSPLSGAAAERRSFLYYLLRAKNFSLLLRVERQRSEEASLLFFPSSGANRGATNFSRSRSEVEGKTRKRKKKLSLLFPPDPPLRKTTLNQTSIEFQSLSPEGTCFPLLPAAAARCPRPPRRERRCPPGATGVDSRRLPRRPPLTPRPPPRALPPGILARPRRRRRSGP